MDLAEQRLAHVLKAMAAGMWEWEVQTDELRLVKRAEINPPREAR